MTRSLADLYDLVPAVSNYKPYLDSDDVFTKSDNNNKMNAANNTNMIGRRKVVEAIGFW